MGNQHFHVIVSGEDRVPFANNVVGDLAAELARITEIAGTLTEATPVASESQLFNSEIGFNVSVYPCTDRDYLCYPFNVEAARYEDGAAYRPLSHGGWFVDEDGEVM